MKKYKAYLYQAGGCDYTIGCGNLLIDIEAKSWSDAYIVLLNVIENSFSHEELRLESVELLEVTECELLNIEAFYIQLDQKENLKRDLQKELEERQHYELLHKKYGQQGD